MVIIISPYPKPQVADWWLSEWNTEKLIKATLFETNQCCSRTQLHAFG